MINLHPPLAAFPPVLLLLVLLFELLLLFKNIEYLRFAARLNLCAALLGVFAAFFSGYQASELANQTFQVSDQLINIHHQSGKILLFLIVPCTALAFFSDMASKQPTNRNKKFLFRSIYLITLCASTILALLTAYRGGELVFTHGAGVKVENVNSALTGK